MDIDKRAGFIMNYNIPDWVKEFFFQDHPEISDDKFPAIEDALKDFYLMILLRDDKNQMISMPSKVVDDLWHAHIIFTREYAHFCEDAFGEMLHHTPYKGWIVSEDKIDDSDSNLTLASAKVYSYRKNNNYPYKTGQLNEDLLMPIFWIMIVDWFLSNPSSDLEELMQKASEKHDIYNTIKENKDRDYGDLFSDMDIYFEPEDEDEIKSDDCENDWDSCDTDKKSSPDDSSSSSSSSFFGFCNSCDSSDSSSDSWCGWGCGGD